MKITIKTTQESNGYTAHALFTNEEVPPVSGFGYTVQDALLELRSKLSTLARHYGHAITKTEQAIDWQEAVQ